MIPRNPDESSDKNAQDKAPQAIDEARNDSIGAPAEPAQQNTPIPDASQEAVLDTRVELDRVEVYLKGPTVFSA